MHEQHRDLPLPDLADPLFAPFWDGMRAGEIRTQYCTACAAAYWPPRHYCVRCGSFTMKWRTHRAEGTLFSWTIVGKATAKGFADVPYAVGLVTLLDEPSVRIVGNVQLAPDRQLRVGQRLSATFVPAGPAGEINLIQWRPATGS